MAKLQFVATLLFFYTHCNFSYSQLNSTCVTPNGEIAICMTPFTCPVLMETLNANTSKGNQFLLESICGQLGETPLFCCGHLGYKLREGIFTIFLKPPVTTTLPPPKKTAEPAIIPLPNQNRINADYKVDTLPSRGVCGLEREENKIIGGETTEIYEFPWAVALEYRSKRSNESKGIRCGGSLINNRYVLTAAHCLDSLEFELSRAWLGDWILSSDPDCLNNTVNRICNNPVSKINIAKKIRHSYFENGNNDVALLKLQEDVRYTSYIRPICLPLNDSPNPSLGSILTAVGWGVTSEGGSTSDFKLKVDIPVVNNNDCQKLTDYRNISANHLCAGGEKEKDACRGDSGGPLMRVFEDRGTQQRQWYLEGIVSWGTGCGVSGRPAVYTRASRYIKWVTDSIAKEEGLL